jgi:hypothetical protein
MACLLGMLAFMCKPKTGKDIGLEAPTPATFEAIQYLPSTDGDYGNAYIFTNTTVGGFLSSWDFTIKKSLKQSDSVFFAYKGTYLVTLVTASKGGTSSISRVINVEQTSPYAADFTVAQLSDYKFIVAVTTPNTTAQTFTYSNGETSTALVDTVYFAFAGAHTITLTVTTRKPDNSLVTSSLTKEVTVGSDDMGNPNLTDPYFVMLTGGLSDVDGRTWVMDPTPTLTGTGPYIKKVNKLSYYNYPVIDPTTKKPGNYVDDPAWTGGALQNEFTFIMRNYQYIPKNDGVTCHWEYVQKFGYTPSQYKDLAVKDPDHQKAPFILKNEGVGITGYTMVFGNNSYMAYYDNRDYYEIAKLANDSLWIRHRYSDDPAANPTKDPTQDPNMRLLLFRPKAGN